MIEKQDDLINEFVFHSWMKKLVRKLGGSEIKEYKREEPPHRSPIDVVVKDVNEKFFVFEFYCTLPSVSDVLLKMKTRRNKHKRYREGKFVAVIPHHALSEYGPHLINEDIIPGYWDEYPTGRVSFGISMAYRK
ncbi:MAG: hypothetical protein KJ886_03460 [Candidatus Thermoplasmatota archaeon]|nr:hypothetical protein [Candidatus Thermoplasmatota archaeon]MCG2827613.1 hypothetical protein [Thermoplasmatales archaeon]